MSCNCNLFNALLLSAQHMAVETARVPLSTGSENPEQKPRFSRSVMTDDKRVIHQIHLDMAEEDLTRGNRELSDAELVAKEAVLALTILEKTSGWEERVSHRSRDDHFRNVISERHRRAFRAGGVSYVLDFTEFPDGSRTEFNLDYRNLDQFSEREGDTLSTTQLLFGATNAHIEFYELKQHFTEDSMDSFQGNELMNDRWAVAYALRAITQLPE